MRTMRARLPIPVVTEGWLTAVAAVALLGAAHPAWTDSTEVILNPEMVAVNLGVECPSWEWSKGAPYSSGEYDAGGVYTLSGNGSGIYWCWDKAGFAFVVEKELNGDFVLICRIKEFPPADTAWEPFSPFEPGNHTVGLTVKSTLDAHSPVLDFRWDYVYRNMLTWFNRQTDPGLIGFCDNCWRGDKLGQGAPECWEGCLNKGYESADLLATWERRDGMWLAVQRKNLEEYYLFARYEETDPWTPIPAVRSGYVPWDSTARLYPDDDWCGLGTTEMPYFSLPHTTNNLVYAGFSVVGRQAGGHIVTAKFDRIELRVGAAAAQGLGATSAPPSAGRDMRATWLVDYRDSQVRIRPPAGRHGAEGALRDLSGRMIARLEQTLWRGQPVFVARSLPAAGTYLATVNDRGRPVVLPVVVPK